MTQTESTTDFLARITSAVDARREVSGTDFERLRDLAGFAPHPMPAGYSSTLDPDHFAWTKGRVLASQAGV